MAYARAFKESIPELGQETLMARRTQNPKTCSGLVVPFYGFFPQPISVGTNWCLSLREGGGGKFAGNDDKDGVESIK